MSKFEIKNKYFGQQIFFLLIVTALAILVLLVSPSTKATASIPAPADEPITQAAYGHPLLHDHSKLNTLLNESKPYINGVNSPAAPCAGGPTIDGVTLDECIIRNFNVGGNARSITVWYSKVVQTVMRTEDGTTYNLTHYINSDAEAEQVAEWAEEAWQRFYNDSTAAGESHEPYINGCSDNLNIQMEDGIGWGGIAYWASSGNCNIGIDAPTVRSGGGQRTVYHEIQHYMQYDYDDGCYGSWKPNYPDNSEFVEGYADFGSNSVDAGIDAGYQVGSYNPNQSIYDEGYSNLFLHYMAERLGTIGTPTDANYHADSMYNHYEECDDWDTLYVLDTLVPELSGGALSKEELVRNFFASLYAWPTGNVDTLVNPDLSYFDADDNSFSQPSFDQNVSMSSGIQTWSDTTPDDWAANYYKVRPSGGCAAVEVEIDGTGGANLGMSVMALNNGAGTLLWSAHTGEDFVKTFAGAGANDEIVAVVNSFQTNYAYDVTFTCVNPQVNILEPRQVNFALVGDPSSPIAFLERFEVTSNGVAVRGLEASQFSFDAEGDAITVSGEFLEVGDEYWTVLLPPIQPAGTTFVDHRVCLNNTICDTEANSLLYVDPGNSDIGLVIDASGSMDDEDVPGEGKRYILAQRAAKVEADLLRNGDRILVTDFSAFDNPAGCGLPGGDGNCPLDIDTLLPRTDVVVPGTINAAKNAIDLTSPREWTPIGEALVDAKNQLLAVPTNINPKHIFLLSDGEENVNRLYADVQAELISSGVVIHTICFGPSCPGGLLAQIAADTGGQYREVPTSPGTLLAEMKTNQALRRQMVESLAADYPAFQEFQSKHPEAASQFIEQVSTPYIAGQLGLADVYNDYDDEAQDAARIFHVARPSVPGSTWEEWSGWIDSSVNTARFVVAGKQNDTLGCAGDHRYVEVKEPGANSLWIPISPPGSSPPIPSNWDIRNSTYDDVLIVTNPQEGNWSIRTQYQQIICTDADGESDIVQQSQEPPPYAFIMNLSVQSTIHLEGRLLGLTNYAGVAGDEVGIVGTLLTKDGTIPGAFMIGLVEKPNDSEAFFLFDDGLHGDGDAGDGIYGWNYTQTDIGGSYGVRLLAAFPDPSNPGQTLIREWNGAFYIDGPEINDQDNDGMPDDWERRCKLDLMSDDSLLDNDLDGLSNIEELIEGTLPCKADTDNGGESDGSEVNGGRNPLWPRDDMVKPITAVQFRPLNQAVAIGWSYGISYTNMFGFIGTDPDILSATFVPLGQTGNFSFTNLLNDTDYYIWLIGVNGSAAGPVPEPLVVRPKADPDPPGGWMLINNGAPETSSKAVMLNISAQDTPFAGAAESSNAHMTDQLSRRLNEVSGGIQMKISNDPNLVGAVWQPLAQEVPWTLSCPGLSQCRVYIQFKDAAGNESSIVEDDIYLNQVSLFLPYVTR